MRTRQILVFLLLQMLTLTLADIVSRQISSDSRPLIHLQTFGFSSNGTLSLSLSDPTFSSPDPSLLGLFLVSAPNLLKIRAHQNPNSDDDDCLLSSPHVRLLLTFLDLPPPPIPDPLTLSFHISRPNSYSLFFANCARDPHVSFTLNTSLFNSRPDGSRDFLPIGDSPLPQLSLLFALLYSLSLLLWIRAALLNNPSLSRQIHHLMAGLLLIKVLTLLSQSGHDYLIKTTGHARGWGFLSSLFHILKGAFLFAVIALIGSGWSFLRPSLPDREKRVLMAVVPLQLAANVGTAVVTEPFWVQLATLVDLACCFGVLFPVVWSIRDLKGAGRMDAKGRRDLAKLVVFRRFYLVVVGYLYLTRVVVFVLGVVLSFEYSWVRVAVDEAVTVGFYGVVFWMVRPRDGEGYFGNLSDKEETEAAKELRDGLFDV